jgi:hypothetical protein
VRLVWQTDQPGDTVVEYGTTEDLGDVFVGDVFSRAHVADVPGLDTETKYYYRVNSCGVVSSIFSFRTAPEAATPFTFAAYGDNRSIPENHAAVAAGIENAAPDILLNTGDVVGEGWDEPSYDTEFFGPAGELFANTPLFISIGNHEGESPFHYRFFPYPGGRGYYSFTYGNTFFICLNTNRLYLPGTPQYDWLIAELQSPEAQAAEWIVAFAHHPPYSEGWDSPGYDGEHLMRWTVLPLFEQYHVDLYFAGHTHDYERGALNGVTYIITGGGGSALDSWQQDFSHIEISQFRYHYVLVSVAGDTLQLDAADPDGTVFDTITLTH